MIKGKLFLLLSALSLGKDIRVDRDKTSIDELFKELQEIAHTLPKTIAMAQSSSQRPQLDRQSIEQQPERGAAASGMSHIDHSRLPPEVAAVLSRTPRTLANAYESTAEYKNPVLYGKAPLRQSPKNVRSKSRERTISAVLNESVNLANEIATDFVERGSFNN